MRTDILTSQRWKKISKRTGQPSHSHWQERRRPARPRTQHGCHHDTKVKPEAATAVIELLMMGRKTPETCWAVNKRQDNKLENGCIWLVIYLNCNISVTHTAKQGHPRLLWKELKVCFCWTLYLEWVGLFIFWSEALRDFQVFLLWAVFSHVKLIILAIEYYAIFSKPDWSTNYRRLFSLPEQHRSWHVFQKCHSWNTQYCWRQTRVNNVLASRSTQAPKTVIFLSSSNKS